MNELLSALLQHAKDVIDILVVAFVIYHALLMVKGTRGWQMTLGLIALMLFSYMVGFFELRAVSWLVANFGAVFVFALVVLFQAEIRRGLAQIGRGSFFTRFGVKKSQERLDEVVLAATTLASQKVGALLVIERDIGLKNYIDAGIRLDAYLTYDLLVTIFNPRGPLHDGAVILRQDRVAAAACFLPVTLDPYLSKELGTRHRAAIGITEESDAIAVVVSEETGTISAVSGGEISRALDGPRLLKYLKKAMESSDDKAEDSQAQAGTPDADGGEKKTGRRGKTPEVEQQEAV